MKAFILALISGVAVMLAYSQTLDELLPQLTLMERLEQLSQEKKYGEIFDSMASDYRNDVSRESWIRKSEELGWTVTKARIGTFSEYGGFADAPVRSDTIVGRKVHHIDAVAYFVREDGVWKLWSFPFVDPELPNRVRWPPPFGKGPNPPRQTPTSGTPAAGAPVAPTPSAAGR